MRVSLVSASDPFDETAGAERTLTRWLTHLSSNGHHVDVLTYGTRSDERVRGCDVLRFADKCPLSTVEQHCASTDVDVVLTQGGWGDIALWAADRHDIPSLLCVMSDFDLRLTSGIAADAPPSRAVAVSRDYRKRAQEVYDCPIRTVYPPIDFEYYTVEQVQRETYTMVNPIEFKGGAIFRRLAERHSDQQFLAVMGWLHQRNDDLSFDMDIYDIYSRSINEYVSPPGEPDLSGVQNLEYRETADIRDIYRRTSVLLVPSQWTEAFGRVVLEAMHNGIPVVASDVGGLPEACGGAGMLVDNYDSVDAWSSCLSEVADEDVYERYVAEGSKRAKRYREQQSQEVEKFEQELVAAVDR